MQGFNMGRYHAPSSLDTALSTSSSSSTRQRKPAATQQTVRFEMPFAIWCATCPANSTTQLIGQGVRFNAYKRRIGAYFSTPLWSFRMKHTACGGWIEIRTDPKNAEYVVAEGARRRDTGDDEVVGARTGATVLRTEEEKEKLDAFAALEGKKAEKEAAKQEVKRVDELWSLRQRDWKDPDARNKLLRARFRVERKRRERDEADAERLKERMGLSIELVDEDEGDKRRAEFVDFGEFGSAGEGIAARRASTKPMFGSGTAANGKREKESKRDVLQKELQANTRARMNPFGSEASITSSSGTGFRTIPGIKRKRTDLNDHQNETPTVSDESQADSRLPNETTQRAENATRLVTYGSDSD